LEAEKQEQNRRILLLKTLGFLDGEGNIKTSYNMGPEDVGLDHALGHCVYCRNAISNIEQFQPDDGTGTDTAVFFQCRLQHPAGGLKYIVWRDEENRSRRVRQGTIQCGLVKVLGAEEQG